MKIDNFKANGFKWDEKQLVEEVLDFPRTKLLSLPSRGSKTLRLASPSMHSDSFRGQNIISNLLTYEKSSSPMAILNKTKSNTSSN